MGFSRRIRVCLGLLVVLGGLGLGCRKSSTSEPDEPAAPQWFEDVTREVGLDFVHDLGPRSLEEYHMPQSVGSGAALFDFDGDGRLDLYLLNNGGPSGRPNQLFRQRPDGTFENVSQGSGLDFSGYCMGVAIGDVNNDGRPDVLVTEDGGLRLFLNQGNGKFIDATKDSGLDNPAWCTSAAFFDYNRDGWLDLVVVNYVDYVPTCRCPGLDGRRDYCGPNNFAGKVTKLYRNLGRSAGAGPGAVRFEDVTVAAGLAGAAGPGLGVLCADFSGDGWPDILVANDGKPNHLWINRRDGTFKEEGVKRGIANNGMGKAEANMGIALGDVDGDGLFDIFITHLNDERHRLWKQGPRGQFHDDTLASGLTAPAWNGTAFGTVLADFDHDGAVDLALVNGHVRRMQDAQPDNATLEALGPFWARYADRHQLFVNKGNGQFADVSQQNPAFCATPSVGRGLAWGDVNNDGAIDLVVTSVAGSVRLFRNVAPKKGHWLLVRAIDPALQRDAYGAEVTVIANQRRWMGLVNPGSSYLCSNDPRAHFGLGQATQVDALRVLWPDGTEEAFAGGAADRIVILRKGKANVLASDRKREAQAQPRLPRRRWDHSRWLGIAAAAVVLLLGVSLYQRFTRSDPPKPPPAVELAGVDPAIAAAVEQARARVVQSPDSAPAWGKLGMVYLVHQFEPQAVACFEQAERLDPRDPRWPYFLALEALLRTDLPAARGHLERAVDRAGEEFDGPRLALAETLLNLEEVDAAQRQFTLLLEKNPRHARANLGLARVMGKRGDPRASLEPLAVAEGDAYTQKAACELLAEVQERLGEPTQAEESRRRAAELPADLNWPDPLRDELAATYTGKLAWLRQAEGLQREGRQAEALAKLQRAVREYPDADDAWFALGKVLYQRNMLAPAEAALRRTVALAPTTPEPLNELGRVLAAQGNRAEAAKCFRKALELRPNFAQVWYNLGSCLVADDRAAALEAYGQAVRYAPEMFEAEFALALLLADRDRPAEALVHAERAVRLKPGHQPAQQLLEQLKKTPGSSPPRP